MSELASRLSKEAQSGGPFDLRRAREEIIEKHRRATTTDERVLCLRLHQAVMDAVARQNVARENMEEFRKVRLQDYRALLLVPRVMYRPPRITVADLEETKRSFPKEFQENKSRLIFTLAGTIIRHFFGRDWVENNIIQDETYSRPPGFFRLDFSSDNERELKTFRGGFRGNAVQFATYRRL